MESLRYPILVILLVAERTALYHEKHDKPPTNPLDHEGHEGASYAMNWLIEEEGCRKEKGSTCSSALLKGTHSVPSRIKSARTPREESELSP